MPPSETICLDRLENPSLLETHPGQVAMKGRNSFVSKDIYVATHGHELAERFRLGFECFQELRAWRGHNR